MGPTSKLALLNMVLNGYIQTFDADIKMFYSDPLYANTLVEAMEYLCLQNNFTCSVNIQPFPSQHAPCGIQILRQHLLCLLP